MFADSWWTLAACTPHHFSFYMFCLGEGATRRWLGSALKAFTPQPNENLSPVTEGHRHLAAAERLQGPAGGKRYLGHCWRRHAVLMSAPQGLQVSMPQTRESLLKGLRDGWLPQGAERVKGHRVPQTPECPLWGCSLQPEVPVGRRGVACAQTSELLTGFQGEVFKGETWGEGLQRVR